MQRPRDLGLTPGRVPEICRFDAPVLCTSHTSPQHLQTPKARSVPGEGPGLPLQSRWPRLVTPFAHLVHIVGGATGAPDCEVDTRGSVLEWESAGVFAGAPASMEDDV